MPEPINPHASYGQKLIGLFTRLLFSQREYSLIELADILRCSKQTVMRLIEDIQLSYGVKIEESFKDRKKYYKLKRISETKPLMQISQNELSTLQMCMSFTKHLMGKELFDEALETLEINQLTSPGTQKNSSVNFGSFHTGRIDYTPHQGTISSIIDAMNAGKACQVKYQKIMAEEAHTFLVEPLKIFSHQDSIYLHAKLRISTKDQYNVFAVHRIMDLVITDYSFEIPDDYDFDNYFNQSFGVIKDDTFEVTLQLKEFAAAFAYERTWNSESRKEWIDDDTLILTFETSSKPELIGWILSWAGRAKVLEPDWLAEEVHEIIHRMAENIS